MAKHAQTIPWQIANELLSVFDHFVKLAVNALSKQMRCLQKQHRLTFDREVGT